MQHVAPTAVNDSNKIKMFKNFAPFTDCMWEINNTKVDNAKETDSVMTVYNLKKYGDNCSKISESFK